MAAALQGKLPASSMIPVINVVDKRYCRIPAFMMTSILRFNVIGYPASVHPEMDISGWSN